MIPRFKSIALVTSVVAAVLLAAVPLRAESPHHDAVRLAVERGEIRALADILTIVRGKLPGEVTGVDVERKNGRWLYEFRAIDGNGRLFEVYVDAKSGEIERIKEK